MVFTCYKGQLQFSRGQMRDYLHTHAYLCTKYILKTSAGLHKMTIIFKEVSCVFFQLFYFPLIMQKDRIIHHQVRKVWISMHMSFLVFVSTIALSLLSSVQTNFLIILLQSSQVLTSLREFTLLHTFTHIPVSQRKEMQLSPKRIRMQETKLRVAKIAITITCIFCATNIARKD